MEEDEADALYRSWKDADAGAKLKQGLGFQGFAGRGVWSGGAGASGIAGYAEQGDDDVVARNRRIRQALYGREAVQAEEEREEAGYDSDSAAAVQRRLKQLGREQRKPGGAAPRLPAQLYDERRERERQKAKTAYLLQRSMAQDERWEQRQGGVDQGQGPDADEEEGEEAQQLQHAIGGVTFKQPAAAAAFQDRDEKHAAAIYGVGGAAGLQALSGGATQAPAAAGPLTEWRQGQLPLGQEGEADEHAAVVVLEAAPARPAGGMSWRERALAAKAQREAAAWQPGVG
eukprot:scaffold6.g2847.t1